MMCSKLYSFAATIILAVATPALCQCGTTSKAMCCNEVESAGSPAMAGVLSAIGVIVQDVSVPVGVDCSPITVIGAGSAGCDASPVCCTDTSHGAVAIGCLPIDVDL